MRFRHLLSVLALLCAQPALGANTVSWTDANSGVVAGLYEGGCVQARFTATTGANESVFLYVGSWPVSIQVDGDAVAAGASDGDLFACSSPDGNRDGTLDTTACAALNLVDTDADGVADDNTLDGTAGKRGILDPIGVSGWLYVDPNGASITGAEIYEVTVCAVK